MACFSSSECRERFMARAVKRSGRQQVTVAVCPQAGARRRDDDAHRPRRVTARGTATGSRKSRPAGHPKALRPRRRDVRTGGPGFTAEKDAATVVATFFIPGRNTKKH